MDRTWMINRSAFDRQQTKYIEGVETFLVFAFNGKTEGDVMRCPCQNCLLTVFKNRDSMWLDLMQYGIMNDYNPWEHHGEDNDVTTREENSPASDEDMIQDDMMPLLHEANTTRFSTGLGSSSSEFSEGSDELPENFERLMKSAKEDLYHGCKTFSKLEFMITLLHIKVSHKWSDKSFSMLLDALHRVFGFDETFPKNSYEAKKYTKDLVLECVKIDACVNHCILFRKKYANFNECPKCGSSRWKDSGHEQVDSDNEEDERSQTAKKIPKLVLHHFQVKPRLQRIFMSPNLARYMRWHKVSLLDDGIIRHPADSKAWKHIDECFPSFAADPRNVRLGLSSDGFNPGGQTSTAYSIWPVFLIPYNLPPWMCLKSEHMILSLLIPGPKYPGNDIDVFLQPLIDELKDLWEIGVKTYDAFSKKTFQMHEMLIWTINDFPAYANLSGWSTKGAHAAEEKLQFRLLVFSKMGKPLGKASYKQLPYDQWRQAQSYVLRNFPEVDPYFLEYENLVAKTLEFDLWFEQRIKQLWKQGDERVNEELLCLAQGPMKCVTSYDGFVINGYRFHTKRRQRRRKTQNCGVVVKGDDDSGCRDYYGLLEEVVVLEYDPMNNDRIPKAVLFKCKWFDVYDETRGIKKDIFGITLVNISRRLQTNEPFSLAAQVQQVFYIHSHIESESEWRVVIKTSPRHCFDFPNGEHINGDDEGISGPWQDELPLIEEINEGNDDVICHARTDIEPKLADIDEEIDEDEDEEEEDEEAEEEDSEIEELDVEVDDDLVDEDDDYDDDDDYI